MAVRMKRQLMSSFYAVSAPKAPKVERVVYEPRPVQARVDLDDRIRDAMRRIEKTRAYLARQ